MSTVPDPPSVQVGAIASFTQRHTLTTFFVLVFALTWPLQVVDALGSHNLLSFRVPLLIQILFVAYMPTAAALIVAWLTGGGANVRALLRKLLIWRVAPRWYLIAIFSYALLCGAAVLLANGLSNTTPVPLLASDVANTSAWQLLLMVPLLFVVVTITNGEELAWRGFALPRLQDRHSALIASLILGVIWAAFHLPLFLTRMGPPLDFLSMISRSTQIVGASVIFTWLYNHTRGSVLLAYLLHGSANTWTRVFPMSEAPPLVGWLFTALVWLVALFLIATFGAEHLKRTGQRVTESDTTSEASKRFATPETDQRALA